MKKIDLNGILPEVASILGGTVSVQYDWAGSIDVPGVNKLARIYFRADSGHVYIAGGLKMAPNEYKYYLPPRPGSIGVSQSRGAQAIAREIQRRLLPAYSKWVNEAERLIAEQDKSDATCWKHAESLRKVIGDTGDYEARNFYFRRYSHEKGRTIEGEIRTSDVELNLHVSFEEAKTILELLSKEKDNA